MRSVSRPTSALTALARPREVAAHGPPLDPPDVVQQIAEREQAVEDEDVNAASAAAVDAASASRDERRKHGERHAGEQTNSRMPPP